MAELARRELARRNYEQYLSLVQGPQWVRTGLSQYLSRKIQAFLETETGHAYDILLIETPPQHGKSMTVTESVPSWYLGKHPESRIIMASYNEGFAERFLRRNKEKIRRFGKNLFGIEIGSVDRATELELTNGMGRIISRGLLSGITGNPANLILIDDPVKNRQEADSETTRDKVWEEWQNSLKSRLAAGAKVIVIMTPWHEDDLAARILKSEANVELVRLPVEAEEHDPMGRKPGEALCPELGKDAKWLAEFKRSYLSDAQGGARAWMALYQCSPRVEGGNLVRRDWWKFYDSKAVTSFGTEVISVDAAFKGAEDNDFVAITVWGKRGNDYYLRYCLNRHLDFPGTLAAIRTVRGLYPNARAVLIEDKANGSAVIQVLQAEMFCIPIQPLGGKVARVNAVSPAIESGHVYVPEGEPWVEEFLGQWTSFPAGAHDDMCFAAGTLIATSRGDIPIERVHIGDKVVTPFGFRSVIAAGMTGVSETVNRFGITGTADHPFVEDDGNIVRFDELRHGTKLSAKEMLKWTYRKLLCSMEQNTGSWEQDGIILANLPRMKDGDMRKDFMWRFGNFIQGKQFRKAMKFIIKTAMCSITVLKTWSVYRAQSIARSQITRLSVLKNTLIQSAILPQIGIGAKKAGNGTENTLLRALERLNRENIPASSVGRSSWQRTEKQNSVQETAARNTGIETKAPKKYGYARCAGERSVRLAAHTGKAEERAATHAERSLATKRPVYNLTVEEIHFYYANRFLVHNCDSSSQALQYLLRTSGAFEPVKRNEWEIAQEQEERAFLDDAYDVYG